MAKMKRNTLAVGLIAVGCVALASLGMMAKQPDANRVPAEELRQKETKPLEVTVKPDEPTDQHSEKVMAYTAVLDGDDVKYQSSEVDVPSGKDPRSFAVEQFVSNYPTAPKGTMVKSVTLNGQDAVVDLSSAASTGFSSGDEAAFVNGILTTLGQFKDIATVAITVEGQPIETLGHLELSGPQNVIRP